MTTTSTTSSVLSDRPAARPAPASRSGWTGGRVLSVILGSFLALAGLGLLAGGGIAWGVTSERDHAGYFVSHTERFRAGGAAVVSDPLDLGDEADRVTIGDLVKLRLRATPASGEGALFLGIGRAGAVDEYLAGVPHRVVTDFDISAGDPEYRTVRGDRVPGAPGEQHFWAVSSTGTGRRAVTWEPEGGDWKVVVMNADATPDVAADVDAGVSIDQLFLFVGLLLGTGGVLVAGGTVAIVLAVRRASR